MGLCVAQKLIAAHLVAGDAQPGEQIGLRVDQTLTQDATGTMVMLELELRNVDDFLNPENNPFALIRRAFPCSATPAGEVEPTPWGGLDEHAVKGFAAF